MNRFLTRRTPPFRRVLLVESGSREVAERWLDWLRGKNPQASVDVLTCYEGAPSNHAAADGSVYTTLDSRTSGQRSALAEHFRGKGYDIIAILCTAEPIMTKWKWYLAWKVPAKLLIVNENADWFWVDRGHWRAIRHFATFRAGLSGSGAMTQPLKLLLFPFTLTYLALYAAFVHLRRRFAR